MSRQMLTAEETDEIRKVFTSLDADGDGTLSKDEIKDGFIKHYNM
jgi:Ca2+-binding EF-hand superfamily protein